MLRQFQSNLDSSDTLKQVAHRLPNFLYAKWVEVAADILTKDEQPKFLELMNFVKTNASVASTLFGRDFAAQSKSRFEKNTNKIKQAPSKPPVTTLVTNVKPRNDSTNKPTGKSSQQPVPKPSKKEKPSYNTSYKLDEKPGHFSSRLKIQATTKATKKVTDIATTAR